MGFFSIKEKEKEKEKIIVGKIPQEKLDEFYRLRENIEKASQAEFQYAKFKFWSFVYETIGIDKDTSSDPKEGMSEKDYEEENNKTVEYSYKIDSTFCVLILKREL